MTRRGRLAFGLLVIIGAALGLGIWLNQPNPRLPVTNDVATSSSGATGAKSVSATRTPGAADASPQSDGSVAPGPITAPARTAPAAPVAAAPVEQTPESTSLPPATVLENMRTRIRQFASTFGENPVGNNQEITEALNGGNPKNIKFLGPDGNRVNSNGELVDVWGTPYFFHQISGHEMEIRSAGPDRVMYTADDLIIR